MVTCRSSPVSTSQIHARRSHPAVSTWVAFEDVEDVDDYDDVEDDDDDDDDKSENVDDKRHLLPANQPISGDDDPAVASQRPVEKIGKKVPVKTLIGSHKFKLSRIFLAFVQK